MLSAEMTRMRTTVRRCGTSPTPYVCGDRVALQEDRARPDGQPRFPDQFQQSHIPVSRRPGRGGASTAHTVLADCYSLHLLRSVPNCSHIRLPSHISLSREASLAGRFLVSTQTLGIGSVADVQLKHDFRWRLFVTHCAE